MNNILRSKPVMVLANLSFSIYLCNFIFILYGGTNPTSTSDFSPLILVSKGDIKSY